MDIANILKPYLTNGDLRVIGATTFDEYQKTIENDDALARRFQTIFVEEISNDDAKQVMRMLKPQFEQYHKVKIPDEVLDEAVDLTARYITNKYLPDKAIDVIDEAAAAKKVLLGKGVSKVGNADYQKQLSDVQRYKDTALKAGDLENALSHRKKEERILSEISKVQKKTSEKLSKKAILEREDVRKVVSRWSNVPLGSMKSGDLKNIQQLNTNLEKKNNWSGRSYRKNFRYT